MFINKFLRSIHSDHYSNISEIIDLNKCNNFASKYGVFIVDYNNFTFTIEEAIVSGANSSKDVKDDIVANYYKNNSVIIPIHSTFHVNDSNAKPSHLTIKYNLNNGFFYEQYPIDDNKLMQHIHFNFDNLKFEGNFCYNQDEMFFDMLRNIPFNKTILHSSQTIINNLIQNNSTNKYNVIHLRLEDDAIDHFYDKCNVSKSQLKSIIENKYIKIIKEFFNNNDTILLLTYNTDNAVIHYLKTNNYKCIINDKKDKDREISAIHDMLLGEYCNNYYVFVWESSFSYTLLSRINKKPNVKAIQISYVNLHDGPQYITLKY